MNYRNYVGEKDDLKAEIEKQEKQLKMMRWVTIGVGAGMVGALIWAFTK